MTEDDWLDACADRPDDDLLRFAFADWLADRGDADRAEFIRLRVELSRQETPDVERKRRTAELLKRHRSAWLGPLVNVAAAANWDFPRGLPEELHHWTAHLGTRGAEALASSPQLVRLTVLRLGENYIGDEGMTALAASSHLRRLTTLHLERNFIGDAGAAALAASPRLLRLAKLNLYSNQIGPAGAMALASSPHLGNLIVLDLWGNRIGNPGAEALARSPCFTLLRSLDLRGNGIGTRARRALKHLGNRVLLD